MINGIVVQNNPLKYVDPEGLRLRDAWNGTTPRIQERPTTVANFADEVVKGLANDVIGVANQVAKEIRFAVSDPAGYLKAGIVDTPVAAVKGLYNFGRELGEYTFGTSLSEKGRDVVDSVSSLENWKNAVVDGIELVGGARLAKWLTKPSTISNTLRNQYASEVEGLSAKIAPLRASGNTSEQIARSLNAERRNLGIKYKNITPSDELQKINQRNLDKYGDKLGPSIDYLRSRGKTWDQIIESATRPGGKDLGY